MTNERTNKNKLQRSVKILAICAIILGIAGAVFAFAVNTAVTLAVNDSIITPNEAAELDGVDCIIVLGCQVKPDGEPSKMLRDRIMKGVELYHLGVSDIVIMSGDSKKSDYDETGVMAETASLEGVDPRAILRDGYGLSTYDSIYRAAKYFGYEKIVIVTQEYHLYRALYIAKQYGIEAYGVPAAENDYPGQILRDLREVAARVKDWAFCILKPEAEMGTQIWAPQQ